MVQKEISYRGNIQKQFEDIEDLIDESKFPEKAEGKQNPGTKRQELKMSAAYKAGNS